jgi:hypothetical protein
MKCCELICVKYIMTFCRPICYQYDLKNLVVLNPEMRQAKGKSFYNFS